jgi:hypothetical protein
MVLGRMGLLDDAIREHLELKRRRGADPDEVAREQREALDSPPASADAQEDPQAAAAPAQVSGAPLVDPGVTPSAAPAGEEASAEPVAPRVASDPGAPPPAAALGETAELDMSRVLGEDTEQDAGAAPAAPVRAQADALEWEMPGDDQAPEAEEPGEDVLEETPDFLRETPEQERLWFEQRPPRDFDFDK